jgi:hypothetical protein
MNESDKEDIRIVNSYKVPFEIKIMRKKIKILIRSLLTNVNIFIRMSFFEKMISIRYYTTNILFPFHKFDKCL